MKYILIIMLWHSYTPTRPIYIEFNGIQECTFAENQMFDKYKLHNWTNQKVELICVPKGKE